MEKLEDTIGFQLAMTFKPFIDPKCTEHMEIVKDMAKSINRHIGGFTESDIIRTVKLARKLKPEFLSSDILEIIKTDKATE